MCAIAGILGLDFNEFIVASMHETMRRRGPDAITAYQKEDCALLHSRLAIIDPENGQQPMKLQWNHEQYVIVYNGELYNTEQVRGELIRLGHHFASRCDTEVVLHAYCQWGEDCLHKFNGIFAFAVWEEGSRRLFIARDRIGVKPLFYKLHHGGLLFSSEIKTILQYPTVDTQLDALGAAQIFLLGPGRMPGSGVFRGILELEPGCCGTFCLGKWCWRRYWTLKDAEHTDTFDQTVEKVRYLVEDSIKRQTVSDVPLGTFLSGGLDSSLISAICGKEAIEKGEQIHTFSVDYENNDLYFTPGKFQPESDNHYIHMMCEHIQSEHHWTVLTAEELNNTLWEAVVARDLPGMADVDSSLLAFCKRVRKYVKVALSGECADEIFGGYPWYRDEQIRSKDGFPWAQNSAQRAQLLLPEINAQIPCDQFVGDLYRQTIDASDILPDTDPLNRRMKEMVNLNQKWFMQTLLDRKDRMSMYNGLEVRVPFCDYRIAEYLYTVPWEFKDYQGREKGLLRYAMRGYLPEQVLWRKKSPYPKTFDPAYLRLVRSQFQQMLKGKEEPIFQLISRSAVEEILSTDSQWPWYGQLMKMPQTIAYMLMVNQWLKGYKISVVY